MPSSGFSFSPAVLVHSSQAVSGWLYTSIPLGLLALAQRAQQSSPSNETGAQSCKIEQRPAGLRGISGRARRAARTSDSPRPLPRPPPLCARAGPLRPAPPGASTGPRPRRGRGRPARSGAEPARARRGRGPPAPRRGRGRPGGKRPRAARAAAAAGAPAPAPPRRRPPPAPGRGRGAAARRLRRPPGGARAWRRLPGRAPSASAGSCARSRT